VAWCGHGPSSVRLCAWLVVVEFFIFILFFIRFIKNIYPIFFLQKYHPAAGSFGGNEIPPDEPAVRVLAHRLTTYRRFIRR